MITWILCAYFLHVVAVSLANHKPPDIRYCSDTSDCRAGMGEICWFFNEGCGHGQCICDPSLRKNTFGQCEQALRGGDRCGNEAFYGRCPDVMVCQNSTCICPSSTMTMTTDGLFCLSPNQRLLGDECTPGVIKCMQRKKATGIYTDSDVICGADHLCHCDIGYKDTDSKSCEKRGLGESGCRKTHHCDGGALCIHGRCECPSGYKAHYNKCIKQGATSGLGLGERCDEFNERRYCRHNLQCIRCEPNKDFRCVRYHPSHNYFLSSAPSLVLDIRCTIVLSLAMIYHFVLAAALAAR